VLGGQQPSSPTGSRLSTADKKIRVNDEKQGPTGGDRVLANERLVTLSGTKVGFGSGESPVLPRVHGRVKEGKNWSRDTPCIIPTWTLHYEEKWRSLSHDRKAPKNDESVKPDKVQTALLVHDTRGIVMILLEIKGASIHDVDSLLNPGFFAHSYIQKT